MNISYHGVGFNAHNAASISEAAFVGQHQHLWPELSHEERAVRLAEVRAKAKDAMGYIDFEMVSHDSEATTETIGTPQPSGSDLSGGDEEAEGDADPE